MTLHAAWKASPMPAVIVPEAISRALAAETRDALMDAGYTRYRRLDRASYEEAPADGLSALGETLVEIAREVTGRDLALRSLRALRLVGGDYLLTHHDRVQADRPVQAILDLSPEPVERAAVHYRHRGQVYFVFPARPGALALVERGPTVLCNHTYVSKRVAGAEVVRLVALLG